MSEHPSWLAALDDDDRALFFAEMDTARLAAVAAGNAEPIETCLRAWRVTAEALSDPGVRDVLTGAADDDYEEVSRP